MAFNNNKNEITAQKISIILPCLNEENAIIVCLKEIESVIFKNNLLAEIIIVDNGSTDQSLKILKKYQKNLPELIVTSEFSPGYGAAYKKALSLASGEIFFMADIDNTYDFNDIPRFIKTIELGYDLVVGNRFKGQMKKSAMPFLHKHFGNPILTLLVRLLFRVPIGDIHCGARAITKKAFIKMNLHSTGMEFASEMIIEASKKKLKMVEISINYNNRIGTSKLRSFSDGWRHLRLIIMEASKNYFIIPGIVLCLFGLLGTGIFYFSNPNFFGNQFYLHPLFFFIVSILIGYQLIIFGFFTKIFSYNHLEIRDSGLDYLFKYLTLKRGLFLGSVLFLIGVFVYIYLFWTWMHSAFNGSKSTKDAFIGFLLIILGIQTVSSSLMYSILSIKKNDQD